MLAPAAGASACIWAYGTDLAGEQISINGNVGEELVRSLYSFEDRKYWMNQKRVRAARLPRADFRDRNDYAVTLLHLGEIQPAIQLLLTIEREQPGRYATAANLGTAYELAGNDAEALRWIRQSIVRNGNAHGGTEWLHVRILEAKVATANDPQWLSTHSVLGLDFGSGVVPKKPSVLPLGNDRKPVTAKDLDYALQYQLHERLEFVKAPDPYVASLFFDWANHTVRTGALESAAALYREALRYGFPKRELVARRQQRVAFVLNARRSR